MHPKGETVCHWDPLKGLELPPDTNKTCESLADRYSYRCLSNPPYSEQLGGGFLGPGTEDWAQTVAYYVYGDEYNTSTIGLGSSPIRRQYVKEQIDKLR